MNQKVRRILFLASMSTGILFFQNCSKMAFNPSVAGAASLSSTSSQGGVVDPSTSTPTTSSTPTSNDPSSSSSTCGQNSDTPSTPSTTASNPAPVCTTSAVNTQNQVKILFVVDTSGSNAGQGGTDNNKVWRLRTINDFVNTYGSNPNFYFGLITFQAGAATPQIASGGVGIFTNDASVVQQGIANFTNDQDQGSTPYQAALTMTKNMIAADLKQNPSSTTAYVVVMISDGSPSDQVYLNQSTGIQSLDNDVTSVVNVAPSQVVINTVFLYNPKNPWGSDTKYLQAIASTADGSFVQASSLDTSSLIGSVAAPVEVCQ